MDSYLLDVKSLTIVIGDFATIDQEKSGAVLETGIFLMIFLIGKKRSINVDPFIF